MNILVTGASGFIARHLIPRLIARGCRVWAWTRSPKLCASLYRDQVSYVSNLDCFQKENSVSFDAVINLAGAPIADKRWTEARKNVLLESRLSLTRQLIEFISQQKNKPHTLLSASAIGFYGSHVDDEPLNESAPVVPGFAPELCSLWEAEASKATACGVRVCLLRTGVVLGDGGALAKMRLPFLLGLGGRVGSGKQWMSWIHIDDQVRAIEFLLDQEISGAFNLCSPGAVINSVFACRYAASLNRPSFVPLPSLVPKLLLGEGAELLLEGQRVYPQKLLDAGFEFEYSDLDSAFKNIAKS